MRAFGAFYWLLPKRAYPGAWWWFWVSSAIISTFAALVGFWKKPFQTDMYNFLVGVGPVAIFAAIMIAGPLVAAFRLNREREEELKEALAALAAVQRPFGEDELAKEIWTQLDGLEPAERSVVRRLLVVGPQNCPELYGYVRSLGFHEVHVNIGASVEHRCICLEHYSNLIAIKDSMLPYVNAYFRSHPT